jgi:hypothetical protein
VAEVRILPAGDLPKGGITTDLWRTVRLSEPRSLWPRAIEKLAQQHGEEVATMMLERVGMSPAARERYRPGRGGHRDLYYARIARDYVRLCNRGIRTPTKGLAQRRPFKGQPNAEQAARDAIHAARERGLLTPSPPGRAGGHLTDEAIHLLEQDQRTKRRGKR